MKVIGEREIEILEIKKGMIVIEWRRETRGEMTNVLIKEMKNVMREGKTEDMKTPGRKILIGGKKRR